jgi:hypothetical protein
LLGAQHDVVEHAMVPLASDPSLARELAAVDGQLP